MSYCKQRFCRVFSLVWVLACGEVEQSQPCVTEANASSRVDVKDLGQDEKLQSGTFLSPAEANLLAPFLEDLRSGVREFAPNHIGVCKKVDKGTECAEGDFLGMDAGTLGEGEFIVRGEFDAPELMPEEKWKVNFSVDCEITRTTANGQTTTTKNYSKDYAVQKFAGKDRGYRLSPVYTISSPSASGEQHCKWKFVAHNLDADREWSGSYTVPAKP